MNFLGDFKWYNILLIILLITITVAIIILPTSDNLNASGQCPIVCKQEQFYQRRMVNQKENYTATESVNNVPEFPHKPIDLQKPPPLKIDNEPKNELILFYAMWCGHSRAFLPEWQKFTQWASNNLDKVKVSVVRCEDGNEATCSQKGIKGYPSVVLYLINGSEHKFEGERTVDGLKKFVSAYIK